VGRRAQRLVYTPHCYAFERRDIAAPVRAAYWATEALLALNTSAFAACAAREWQLSDWPMRHGRRYLVPNIAPESVRVSRPRNLGSPLVAGGGRLSPQKDPDFFLARVEQLRPLVPRLRAVWLGDGDAAARSALEAAGIEVTGWLPRSVILERLAGADLYLHSALWEGFPLMVAEAVALRVPTLVRRLPSFADVPRPLTLSADGIETALGCLLVPGAGSENVQQWAHLLRHNTAADQRAALLDVYLGVPDRSTSPDRAEIPAERFPARRPRVA
jgi:glycosyltransferase involved in cell wall biosynthesis